MFDIFKKLLMARQVSFEEGKIVLLGQNVMMIPIDLLVEAHKELEKTKKDYVLYLAAKEGGKKFLINAGNHFKMKSRELVKWSFNIVDLAGYGKGDLVTFKPEEHFTLIRLSNSTYARTYGNSKKAIDIIYRGFIAGMGTISYGTDADTVEMKCISKGDNICEFICKAKNEWNMKDKIVKEQLGAIIGKI